MDLGKVMAIGLYPDRVVLMHAPSEGTPAQGIAKLSLMLTIQGLPKGTFPMRSILVLSNGKEHKNSEETTVTSLGSPTESINMQYRFTPFPVPMAGRFAIRVEIGPYTFEEELQVVQRDLRDSLEALTGLRLSATKPAGKKRTASASAVDAAVKSSKRGTAAPKRRKTA